MARRRAEADLLEPGDVIKTHPFEGYWGCAVVLRSVELETVESRLCLIAVTPIVFTRDFDSSDLDGVEWSVLNRDRTVRVGPERYVTAGRETCMGIYERRRRPGTDVIGSIDPRRVVDIPSEVRVGDGTDGGWPLCGRIGPRFGVDAVHAWRERYDRERWLEELADARRSTEAAIRSVNERERSSRRERRLRKRP